MNSTIKYASIGIVILLLAGFVFLNGMIIQNPDPEDCEVKTIRVTSVYEGGVNDIVFKEANGSIYYINRGLEQGFTIADFQKKVLNKSVTLHLANVITGTSNHISQLALGDEIVFTEFKKTRTGEE